MRRTLLRLASFGPPNTHVQTRFSPQAVNKPAPWNDPTAVIKPGQLVISACRQHDIAFPWELQPLRPFRSHQNTYKLALAVCQRHCFEQQSMRYFDRLEHPFTKSLLDIYIEKKEKPLWISCHAHGSAAFVSRKARKKILHAVRDALVAAGYDRFGRRVIADGESSAILDLYGTLRVIANDAVVVCEAKFADLLKDAKKIVASAEIVLRRNQDGHHVERLQPRQHNKNYAGQGQRRGPSNQQMRRTD
ncbi:hypothetical protein F4803DRAFT_251724 [Xylaria telfairii]|nr:hypothetical protein F4803DRAFT_251724 [Xylaria telfairii]